MTSPLPPDPYAALGVPESADSATIKSTYRKLVLKCHPDKVTDESLKKQKQEEFHKIQQAYEIIGDEEKRAMHD
ncbi:heat shock protein DnaJ, partial [Lepidopterella palustris CBS 459.81]